jgi:hypothetical protein
MNKGQLRMLRLIADTIKEAGSQGAPEGVLWAGLMNHFTGLDAFQSYVSALERSGVIRREGQFLLIWNVA